jgi:hypothetical protein
MRNNSDVANISFVEVFLVLSFTIAVMLFYFYFDSKSILESNIFPWDSNSYRTLAESLHSGNNALSLEVQSPFRYRVLFPWLYGFVHNITGLSYIYSSLIVNLFSASSVLLFSYIFWRTEGVSILLSWLGLVYFSVTWLGPIRQSIFYPGGGFAFEILLVILLFIVVSQSFKKSLLSVIISAILVFFLALGREFITYIVSSITVIHCILKYRKYTINPRRVLLAQFVLVLKSRDTLTLVLASISSLLAYIFVRVLAYSPVDSTYSMIETIITQGWFYMHLGEFLYLLFYVFGPIIVIFISVLMLKELRAKLFMYLHNSVVNIDMIILFCSFGVIFGMVGGTDSDRFLLWFFPFFALFSLKSVKILSEYKSRSIFIVFFILIVSALFGSRFYVPANPNIFFPGDNYGSQANIKTDYNPSLYYGVSSMEKYRFSLKDIPLGDSFIYGSRDSNLEKKRQSPQIPTTISKSTPGNLKHWYRKHYKNEINNIPFPLGFSHNQYETFVAHPSYGGRPVKILILAQWLIVLFVVFFVLRRLLKGRK